MITVEYGPVKSRVTSDNTEELGNALRALRKALTVMVEGYFFSPRYQKGLWDGTQSFISPGGQFKSGLTSRVLNVLQRHGFHVDLIGYPEPHPAAREFSEVSLAEFSLRDYQVEGLHQALRFSRGIMKMATNAGKTAWAAGLLKTLGVPPTLFVVPRSVLIDQASADFQAYLKVPVGVVKAGKFQPNPSGITVAIFHTLVKHLHKPEVKRWLQTIEVLLMDEVHFIVQKGYQKVSEATPARFRLGLSGTPYTQIPSERLLTIGTTGPILSTVSNQELMDKNVSVRPNVCILTPRVGPKLQEEIVGWDWVDAIQRNPNRNRLIAILAEALVASGRQTVVMVSTVSHAKRIRAKYPQAVIAHASSSNKREVLQRLKSGEVFCLICTAIFDTGLSVDHIEGLIMASGGKSSRTLLQRIGRAVRRSKLKEKSLWVFDFMDDFHRICRRHSRARRKIYEDENAFNITDTLAVCPEELRLAVAPWRVSSKNFSTPLDFSSGPSMQE